MNCEVNTMADLNSAVSGYSSSDFTELAGYYMQKLGREFRCLHTRDEFDLLKNELDKRIDAEQYDAKTTDIYIAIYNIFKDVSPDAPEFAELKKILRPTAGNRDKIYGLMDKLAEKLKSQAETDAEFLERLRTMYYDYGAFKTGAEYVRRLVIARLRQISPEFVCVIDKDGNYILSKENDNKGKRALRSDIDSIPTRLLILKQFIKQFGWCGGLKGDDDHGRAYGCEALRQIIENEYQNDRQAAASGIGDEIFERLGSVPNRSLLRIAEDMEAGKFGCHSRNREDLYVFAIAFEMRLHKQAVGDDDIRKNLFFDYYSESLLYEIIRDGKWEADISGYGINYKNFIEICYLYAIESAIPADTDLSSADGSRALYRFSLAKQMIDECRNSENARLEDDLPDDKLTKEYVESFGKEILSKNKEDAVKYIVGNYYCRYRTEEVYSYLDEEKAEDVKVILKYLPEIKQRQSLTDAGGGIWTCSSYHYFDSRDDDDRRQLDILEAQDSAPVVSEDFHIGSVFVYTEQLRLDERNNADKKLIRHLRFKVDERMIEYTGVCGWSGTHRWQMKRKSVLRDLDFSAADRTAGLKYEWYCREAARIGKNKTAAFRQFAGPLFKEQNIDPKDVPLSVIEIKNRIQKDDQIYYADGRSLGREFYNDFSLILFAYDAKIRHEHKRYARFTDERETKDESDDIISRSELMIAALRYAVARIFASENNAQKKFLGSFGMFCALCCKMINDTLLECGFMELNPKDIFDVLILYGAYRQAAETLYLKGTIV